MHILQAYDLCKEWNGRALFQNISFAVKEGEVLALFGRNGVGKTTLLRALMDQIKLDGGKIERGIPLEQWGWLEQEVNLDTTLPLLQFVQLGLGEASKVKQEMDRLLLQMAQGQQEHNLAKYDQLYERYLQLGGYELEIKVEKSLQQMKLDSSLWQVPFGQLSGGQKTRAQLASLMVREPAFIIMDEPTNHLDQATLAWLEDWVNNYTGTILYVSHDRTFINRTATTVLEMEADKCQRYTGGYEEYREQKELELRTKETLYRQQEQKRRELEEAIHRYQQWFNKAHREATNVDVKITASYFKARANKNISRYHAKQSQLERLNQEKVILPKEGPKLNMSLTGETFAGQTLLRMEQVSFKYDETPILNNFTYHIKRHDRIAVVGDNGTGKSTLLKLATGQLQPDEGEILLHPSIKVGYFAQELEGLDEHLSLLDSLLHLPNMTQTYARTILGCFMFSREDVFKVIGDLSMGERCRVALLRLLFGNANLLVLDEPTNYLDVSTREAVEEALVRYPGVILLVTHDRYLAQKISNRLLILEGEGRIQRFEGSYEEYEQSGKRDMVLDAEAQAKVNELERLQMQLTMLLTAPEPDGEEAKAELLKEIQDLKMRVAEIKAEIAEL
ncbi:ATPase subunit of ABC transporter with duplicated ATPase domains [Paenibacillus turicensis]|uniref:ATPase subunit of ABC transporter with duplicated ATPase domains n=1 Tax=Paenibacillus turicensis TaxID=160487 RepID=A0ABS4FYX1_9BACL|nr:ABC-F type ribosomal protection protein [Paenibacillus turicensis]MBP1907773.1 ATPase subunit of ABC transporter with duplicated ATPase domains [Paenibacillus turicensis]